jgi:hypothetical protein
MRRALCVLLAGFALPASALASHSMPVTFEAPRDLTDPAARDGAFDQIGSLGARSIRVILYWNDVAPDRDSATKPSVDLTDPAAYDWSRYDPILQGAKDRGWNVLLTVTGPVPLWATASKKDHVTRPSTRDFQAFVTAAAKHYGSQVNLWSAWNEPNHPDFLMPQYSTKGHRPLSPGIYRQLFLAMWRGLRAGGNPKDKLLMGETAPTGTGKVVAPLTFLRGALCLSSSYHKRKSCSNLPADGYAHHAYTTRLGPFYKPKGPNDVTIGVLTRLVRALDRAGDAGAVKRGIGIYLTEFGIQTDPPDKIYGVPLTRQPEYYALSERLAWKNPRVRSFSQYLLTDDNADGLGGFGGFESGLRFADGRVKKPGYDGFRMPLAAVRTAKGVSLWGRVRPATAPTTVDVLYADKGKSFRKLRSKTTDRAGVWQLRAGWRKGRRWRARWTAADGTVNMGPPIRAYTSRGKVG